MATRASPAVMRIDETAFMQSRQFAQDAGPMAHPIRPDEYEAIDNFYTVTVYERVLKLSACCIPSLARRRIAKALIFTSPAMMEQLPPATTSSPQWKASGRDLAQFKRWYSQAGTPQLQGARRIRCRAIPLHAARPQTMPPTPGQLDKQPMVIPLAVALLQEGSGVTSERVLNLTEKTQSFAFADVPARPIPSLLRAFSAPVKVAFDYGDAQLAALVEHDNDGVSRWQAVRELFFRAFDKLRGGNGAVAALDRRGGLACRLRNRPGADCAHARFSVAWRAGRP